MDPNNENLNQNIPNNDDHAVNGVNGDVYEYLEIQIVDPQEQREQAPEQEIVVNGDLNPNNVQGLDEIVIEPPPLVVEPDVARVPAVLLVPSPLCNGSATDEELENAGIYSRYSNYISEDHR
ncbi:uncharacterized protein LOC119661812 [Teleopsis dalmanni]|uniref:uncharacterized protein LOC119661812 n=1 Tax=Teleopsis dalmanni TaxID=139649 RepID=UPI0018CF6027|nr:uncharacterized protein LOC119661812 [Teleopsis dalmanni]XP_037927231.1 uncharacterized protein LOC119661812 [Teleopsis dalmanni]